MSLSAASKFRSISDFPELVKYLGDELDWPIETDDFEEMTFEYSAAELGLDEKTAPKFVEIRRLRPLDKDQPWGIFFIRFNVIYTSRSYFIVRNNNPNTQIFNF